MNSARRSPVERRRLLAGAAVALCAAAPAAAQVPRPVYPSPSPSGVTQPTWAQGLQGQEPGQGPLQPGQFPGLLTPPKFATDPLDPWNLSPTWVRPDAFQGFPVFPQNLGAWGGYPPAPEGYLQPPALPLQPPPMRVPGPPDWPAWIRSKVAEPLPYAVDVAVLVRQVDRVWLLEPGEPAFVPLHHWDAGRGVPAGTRVRVQQAGEFLLLFQGAARIASHGPCELQVAALTEAQVRVEFGALTHLTVVAYERPLVCALPDGSELRSLPVPEDALAVAATRLFVDRVDEPGWYGGRATIFNGGERGVLWTTPFGDVRLDPGFRVTFLLTPPQQPLPDALTVTDVATEAGTGTEGARRRFRAAGGPGSVAWSGARIELPPGATLELDPMLGDAFEPPPPPPAVPPEPVPDRDGPPRTPPGRRP